MSKLEAPAVRYRSDVYVPAADAEPRWIGVDPSGLIELATTLDRYQGYAAQRLADAVVDRSDTVPWEREAYLRDRAEARRVRALYERCYDSKSIGRFAGYIVRSSDRTFDAAPPVVRTEVAS